MADKLYAVLRGDLIGSLARADWPAVAAALTWFEHAAPLEPEAP